MTEQVTYTHIWGVSAIDYGVHSLRISGVRHWDFKADVLVHIWAELKMILIILYFSL